VHLTQEVSVRELRNNAASVVAAAQAGQAVVLTANHRPIADIVPHMARHDVWVPSAILREIAENASADSGLLEDISDIRHSEVDA
jgi:prevent-host-death family protein